MDNEARKLSKTLGGCLFFLGPFINSICMVVYYSYRHQFFIIDSTKKLYFLLMVSYSGTLKKKGIGIHNKLYYNKYINVCSYLLMFINLFIYFMATSATVKQCYVTNKHRLRDKNKKRYIYFF